ncbi:hypothetical protein BV22DRAFT_1030413 [Leucogyrophana mollusca]|uniref:Uncharacterized protein n=1 Tax=Leucogyrophana mollusca TaxID=85980 RepID=A0ACB8BRV3_9AGAM|nr:hypothetical protein BV22DRAFT_1030413 [Leucogyrophana mollusca]
MSRHPPTLPMSQIIVNDAPLLSPVSPSDIAWNQQIPFSPSTVNVFGWNYYDLPPSPPNSDGSNSTDSPISGHSMLKSRMTPESISDGEQQLCISTHQVFELSDTPSPSSAASPGSGKPPQLSLSIDAGVQRMKRSSSPVPGAIKKHRASGERITCKDFVPPDVSGLSKREARLVKNRAAAFLSRQRKREEYEAMEIRVKELEDENVRLQGISQKGNGHDELYSEVEKLRSRLSAAEKREQELRAELSRRSISDTPVKAEHYEGGLSSSCLPPMTSPNKSGAGLGLMQALLCALPSLLSMPKNSTHPTTFSAPLSGSSLSAASSSAFNCDAVIPDYDWAPLPNGGVVMDLDFNNLEKLSSGAASSSKPRRLEIDSEALSALGGLDISFDASPDDSGKIRVRIHPSKSESTPSAPSLRSNYNDRAIQSSSLSMWAGPDSTNSATPYSSQTYSTLASAAPAHSYAGSVPNDDLDPLGPFLGVGTPHSKFGMEASMMASMYDHSGAARSFGRVADPAFEYFPGYIDESASETARHRARVALKSMPAVGGEGGEWEIQVC